MVAKGCLEGAVMATNILEARGGSLLPSLQERGYHMVYREQETNHCPGCGHTHWYVGRLMAECAFCQTALPLENSATVGGGQMVRTVRRTPFLHEEQVLAA
jgi:hypothetical protein